MDVLILPPFSKKLPFQSSYENPTKKKLADRAGIKITRENLSLWV